MTSTVRDRILRSTDATGFGPPCTVAYIERAEPVPGRRLPGCLKEVYLEVDGSRGPLGIGALWRLRGEGDAAMAGYNVALRTEFGVPSWAADATWYGDDGDDGDDGVGGVGGVGGMYGLRPDVPGVIRWIQADHEDDVVVAPDIFAAWAGLQAGYTAARAFSENRG